MTPLIYRSALLYNHQSIGSALHSRCYCEIVGSVDNTRTTLRSLRAADIRLFVIVAWNACCLHEPRLSQMFTVASGGGLPTVLAMRL